MVDWSVVHCPHLVSEVTFFIIIANTHAQKRQLPFHFSTVHLVSSEGKFVSALIYALTYVGYLTTGFVLTVWQFLLFSQYTVFVLYNLQCVHVSGAGLKVQ